MSFCEFSDAFLCNYNDICSSDDMIENLRHLWSGDWKSVLQKPCFLLPELKEVQKQDAENVLCSTIASLLAFVQANFTGPDLCDELATFIKDNCPERDDALRELPLDGEDLNVNVKYPEALLASKNALDQLIQAYPKSMVLNWWKLRLLRVHQEVLDGLSQSIYSEFCEAVDKAITDIEKVPISETIKKSLLYVEIGFGYLLFNRPQQCEKHLQELCRLLNIELNVEGVLGLRTKFQQKALPQLCLKVKQNGPDHSASEKKEMFVLPKLLSLDDEVLLEKINFLEGQDDENIHFASILQAVIHLKLNLLMLSQPKDKLADEEIEPYINALLDQDCGPLSIRLSTLLLNIRQQKDNKRTVERSLKQCEELLATIDGSKFSVLDRLTYGFANVLTTRWRMRKLLGALMVSLGLIKSALDLYLDIQEWEEVIMCYTILDLKHKAAEIIRTQIEKAPSAKLYCLLGDATDDVSWYKEAWEFSNKTSAMAQRHWGCYYFARKEYANAQRHLQRSLKLNSLQDIIWLRLGYCAIMLEKWGLAAHSYLTYTHIEPHGFESWNNLGTALIKLGDHSRAHKVLADALKYNYNNWMIWHNYMLVSVETENYEDAINAYNRLIELKEKFINLELIEIIARAIAKNLPDSQGRPTERLRKKCATLLGHQCVQFGFEYKLWELAALIAKDPKIRTEKFQKSYAVYTQKNTSWMKTKDTCSRVMDLCRQLSESFLEAIGEVEKIPDSELSLLSSTRLSVQACVRAVENHPEKWDELQGDLEYLKSFLLRITDILKNRN